MFADAKERFDLEKAIRDDTGVHCAGEDVNEVVRTLIPGTLEYVRLEILLDIRASLREIATQLAFANEIAIRKG